MIEHIRETREPILKIFLGWAILHSFAGASVLSQAQSTPNGDLVLVGATVYVSPTEDPIRDAVILIQGGKIAAVGRGRSIRIPRNVQSLDCAGLTITAGFWNSHVHLFERKWVDASTIPASELSRQLQDMFTRYGFTSVFDTGSMWENTRQIRDRVESGEVVGPRIRSTGEALIAPGAMPSERVLGILGFATFPAPEITDAAQAATASRKLLDDGVDGIKVHLQTPPPPHSPFPENAIPAAVAEAHRGHKPVFVHPNTGADVLAAARAGVDVVAHTTPRSGPWDETTLTAMKEQGAALTPTLTLWKSAMRHDRVSIQEQISETAIEQLRAWVTTGGTVLFGTDVGAVDYDPLEEYLLMAEAGMSFRQILASLTTAPAERFGGSRQSGRIAEGQQADLTVLGDNPSENIVALASVRYTIRAGRVIYRARE